MPKAIADLENKIAQIEEMIRSVSQVLENLYRFTLTVDPDTETKTRECMGHLKELLSDAYPEYRGQLDKLQRQADFIREVVAEELAKRGQQ